MKDFAQLSPEELNKMNKQVLIAIIGSLQSQLNSISGQLELLTEQIALMNQRSFGRKTERADQIDQNQLNLFDVFNEPEVLCDDSPEPEVSEVIVSTHTRKKASQKREHDLEGLPARIFEHTLTKEELAEKFPDGYKELPFETYKRLSLIPQTFLVDEHHVHVYVSKNNDGTIVRAERPADVMRDCIATPSLIAALINGKYVNHLPLERQSKCYRENGVNLEVNTLANWMINVAERHLAPICDELHNYLYDSRVIHADETPFRVIMKDKPDAGDVNYMFVYRNGKCDNKYPVVIYDFQRTRSSSHADEFLKGYSGTLVTDGFSGYDALDRRRSDLKVAGCWVHSKRKFAEIVKAIGTQNAGSAIAVKASKKISEMFHIDSQWDDLSKRQREKQRQLILKPKVDDFFEWAKKVVITLPAGSSTARGLNYCINQEDHLRVFLSDGNVPMDNNLAEQAIRPFTLGRKNWVTMYSPKGASASAIIYSLVETAKANELRLYDYFEYLIAEMSKHLREEAKQKKLLGDKYVPDRKYIQDLLPWSKSIQKQFHLPKKKS